jgi:curved DNA-binding protein CbpA
MKNMSVGGHSSEAYSHLNDMINQSIGVFNPSKIIPWNLEGQHFAFKISMEQRTIYLVLAKLRCLFHITPNI